MITHIKRKQCEKADAQWERAYLRSDVTFDAKRIVTENLQGFVE